MPPDKSSPQDMVDGLHTAFGKHEGQRAVHTKGQMLVGSFAPAAEAKTICKAPVFAGGTCPVISRFSLFAGVPTLPDNDDGASPAGLGIKITVPGDDFDIEANQHRDFITATADEFRTFLLAVGAAGKGDKTQLDAFLAGHPHAREFLTSRTYPASYATAMYFGINSVKFTNAENQSVFVRYRFIPQAGEKYLDADARKAAGPTYLTDELPKRVAAGPVVFDWYAQVAEAGDKIEDPSIAWPEARKLVKLGTFTLTQAPANPDAAQHDLLLLPGQTHPGVEPADAMLKLRNKIYPVGFKERQ